MIAIEGSVEAVIYENPENGYTVCDVAGGAQLITMTGYMPGLAEGERIVAHGEWTTHAEYGDQFKVEYYERLLPSTESEIEKYLASGILPGVGKATARKIVEEFGAEALEVIEKQPEKLLVIKGMTLDRVNALYKKFVEQIGVREVVMQFQKYALSASYAVRAYKIFGMNAVHVMHENPYRLAEEVDGISFQKADAIAMTLGFSKSDSVRLAAGIKHLLYQIGYLNGHTYLPRGTLTAQAVHYLEVEQGPVEDAISAMLLDGSLILENMGEYDAVYLRQFYDAEASVAQRLLEMSRTVYDVDAGELSNLVAAVEGETGIQLAPAQLEAVKTVFENAVLVITGGPGTGKTTIINSIIKIMARKKKRVALAAPTGRAAKRMSEVCHTEAKTIHRLLEVEPGADEVGSRFARNAGHPLECDVLIVDEMSMVDILLMHSLLLALPRSARLIMVGDSDQLPSVGAGNVLRDIIESGTLSCIQLTEIFRQAKESMIVVNAHRINHGEIPLLNDRDNDFFFVRRSDPLSLCETIADLCQRRLPSYYGIDSISQIQVLTPTRKTAVGVQYLNQVLQERLNPPDPDKPERATRSCVYRLGDKVMQIRNNYQLEWEQLDGLEKGSGVFNGDVGFITAIDTKRQKLTVTYDDRRVIYDFMMLDELELAYAVTVHKSQGSEFDAVILPMMEVHRLLMTRNLLYTAITRARRLVVLVGQEDVIKRYVDNDNVQMRFSGLRHKLQID